MNEKMSVLSVVSGTQKLEGGAAVWACLGA